MREFDKKHLESELKNFATKNFVKPSACRNLDQIRYYIGELCLKIEDYKQRFNYVPDTAYSLLAKYNGQQNSMLYKDFIRHY
ncbi:MAG: hypothetical protein ABIR06_05495 [Cyclobacteriaceae bacterium]